MVVFLVAVFPFFATCEKHACTIGLVLARLPIALLGLRIIYSQLLSINTRITRSQGRRSGKKRGTGQNGKKRGIRAVQKGTRHSFSERVAHSVAREVRVTRCKPHLIHRANDTFIWRLIRNRYGHACDKFLRKDASRSSSYSTEREIQGYSSVSVQRIKECRWKKISSNVFFGGGGNKHVLAVCHEKLLHFRMEFLLIECINRITFSWIITSFFRRLSRISKLF